MERKSEERKSTRSIVADLVYWPTASSMKSKGTPQAASITRYCNIMLIEPFIDRKAD